MIHYDLFETLKVVNGNIQNIHYHDERVNRSRLSLYDIHTKIKLADSIKVPKECASGIFKCRIAYGKTIGEPVFEPYIRKAVNTISIVLSNIIDYKYKFTDRNELNSLMKQRGHSDEILILRNGLITDTSIANIAFNDGSKWLTPKEPLLKGTKRSMLLDENIIEAADISLSMLSQFKEASIFNAMIELGEISVPMEQIKYIDNSS